jgi:hypothetical protein
MNMWTYIRRSYISRLTHISRYQRIYEHSYILRLLRYIRPFLQWLDTSYFQLSLAKNILLSHKSAATPEWAEHGGAGKSARAHAQNYSKLDTIENEGNAKRFSGGFLFFTPFFFKKDSRHSFLCLFQYVLLPFPRFSRSKKRKAREGEERHTNQRPPIQPGCFFSDLTLRQHPEARALLFVVVCPAQVSMPFSPSCRPFFLRHSRFTAPSASRPPGGSGVLIRSPVRGAGGAGRGPWRGSGVGWYVV